MRNLTILATTLLLAAGGCAAPKGVIPVYETPKLVQLEDAIRVSPERRIELPREYGSADVYTIVDHYRGDKLEKSVATRLANGVEFVLSYDSNGRTIRKVVEDDVLKRTHTTEYNRDVTGRVLFEKRVESSDDRGHITINLYDSNNLPSGDPDERGFPQLPKNFIKTLSGSLDKHGRITNGSIDTFETRYGKRTITHTDFIENGRLVCRKERYDNPKDITYGVDVTLTADTNLQLNSSN